MKKNFKILFLYLICLIMIFSSNVFAADYSDLNKKHWAYSVIMDMTSKKILSGYPDNTFMPDKTVTRAEFAKILTLTLNLNEKNNILFQDVTKEHWAYNYIEVASKYLSAYKGENNTVYFRPSDEAVREDVAVSVVMVAGLQDSSYSLSTLNKFSDKENISENLKKYVAIAVENELMKGNADGTFNPKGKLTRAEVCQLMHNSQSVLEKIVLDGEKIKFPTFTFDEETGTVDLGSEWEKYKYSYGTKIKKIRKPSSQVLTFNELEEGNDYFSGKYLFIIDAQHEDNYVKIKIVNPFDDVSYDSEKNTLNLGSGYKSFKYGYSDSLDDVKISYTPSKKILTYSEDAKDNSGTTFGKKYIFVALKQNKACYTYFEIETQAKENEETNTSKTDIKYDVNTGILDLGENWNQYVYLDEYNASVERGTKYTPSQRYLTYTEELEETFHSNPSMYNVEGECKREILVKSKNVFCGNYVLVMKKDNINDYVKIETPNPFAEVKVDRISGTIDLGKNYTKFLFSYGNDVDGFSDFEKYTPNEKVLNYSNSNNRDKNSTFNAMYVWISLKANPNSRACYNMSNILYTYDNETYTVDLGENWKDYRYTAIDSDVLSSCFKNSMYTPSQRVLSCNYQGNRMVYYFYILNKKNPNNYVRIKVNNPFASVHFFQASLAVHLGPYYKDFVYCYGNSEDNMSDYKKPSKSGLKFSEQESNSTYNGKYVTIALAKNLNVKYCIKDIVPLRYVYDSKNATLDLGEDWQNKLVYFARSLYTPTQRVLNYTSTTVEAHQETEDRDDFDIEIAGGVDFFMADAVYIIDKNDRSIYKKIQTRNPFKNVYYYKIGKERYVHLGDEYENFVYYDRDGNLVEATEESINIEEIKPFHTHNACVAIYLKQNKNSFMEVVFNWND